MTTKSETPGKLPVTTRLFRWVVADAVATVAVFGFVLYLANGQSQVNAKTECWAGVLDTAVNRHLPMTKASHRHLIALADQCARLP